MKIILVLLVALATFAGPAAQAAVTVAAAGDIATSGSGDTATSNLIISLAPDAVLTLGDNAYDDGSTTQFNTYYDPTWGRFLGITHPSLGNHDWHTSGAAGYFGYFGAQAPAAWYSYDLGRWHFVALDSHDGGVPTVEQVNFLRADLAASTLPCTIIYFHHPRYSSGSTHGSNANVQPFWQAAADYDVELVLNGHVHNYERFARKTADGTVVPKAYAGGAPREFVVGTGGASNYGFSGSAPGSQVRIGSTFGVLKLVLRRDSYVFDFVNTSGTSLDHGRATCT